MTIENKGFVVGAEVIAKSRGGLYQRPLKIVKVYKNGNFVLEGDKQQYKPAGSGLGNTQYAHKAGKRDGWSSYSYLLYTDALRAEVTAQAAKDKRAREVRNMIEEIRTLPIESLTDENVELLRAFYMTLKSDDKQRIVRLMDAGQSIYNTTRIG
jgi:hypothetical protein